MACIALELRFLLMPRARLRACLGVFLAGSLIVLPGWCRELIVWLALTRYVPLVGVMAHKFAEQCAATRRAEAAGAENAEQVQEQVRRIAALEADLVQERLSVRTRSPNEDDPLYRQVGLHRHAPDWLIPAVRRAYRARLHPDRHPRHREQAHERYLRAETIFAAISKHRGLSS